MKSPELAPANLAAILQAGWGIAPTTVHTVHARWFTGKVLARCDAADGAWCLAGSPEAYRGRVATAAGFQARLNEAGCRVLPTIRATVDGELLHVDGDSVWTVTSWEDGAPEHDHDRWSGSMLEQLGRAVGELHRLGRRVVPEGADPQLAPGQFWAADWRGFEACARDRWDLLVSDPKVRSASELDPLRACVELGLGTLPSLGASRIRNRTVAHDDLWTEHVLFKGDGRLSAIIDLDGLDAGDGHGDLSALLSDFANLEPELCAQIVRGYRTKFKVSEEDLLAARATIIRHHLLTLMERIQLWQEQRERREELISPVGYWLRSLRRAAELDADEWVSSILSACER